MSTPITTSSTNGRERQYMSPQVVFTGVAMPLIPSTIIEERLPIVVDRYLLVFSLNAIVDAHARDRLAIARKEVAK